MLNWWYRITTNYLIQVFVAHLHSTQYNAVTFIESLPFSPNGLYALQGIPDTMRLQSVCRVGTLQIFMKSTSFHFYITSFQYTSIALSEIDSTDLYRKGHGFYELNSAFSALTWKGYIRNCVDQTFSHFTTCETDTGSLQYNTVLPYCTMRITKLSVGKCNRSTCNPKILLGILYEAKRTPVWRSRLSNRLWPTMSYWSFCRFLIKFGTGGT